MPVSVACDSCGKRLTVRDELLGKKLKCPACQHVFTPTAHESAKPRPAENSGAGLALPMGLIWKLSAAGAVVAALLLVYFGLVRNHYFYEEVIPGAKTNIEDVLVRGLQIYEDEHGIVIPAKPRSAPQLYDLTFQRDLFRLSRPKALEFRGTTNEGVFAGRYELATGEVDLESDIGAAIVPGMAAAVKPGHTRIKITGRVKDDKVTLEIDGKPAK